MINFKMAPAILKFFSSLFFEKERNYSFQKDQLNTSCRVIDMTGISSFIIKFFLLIFE